MRISMSGCPGRRAYNLYLTLRAYEHRSMSKLSCGMNREVRTTRAEVS